MPLINIEYDDSKVKKNEILELSKGVQEIVSEETEIKDVFVYANTSQIKVQISPIEIFIQMTSQKIKNEDELINKIKVRLIAWKKENSFSHPINLTLIPMHWKIEIGI